jgi:hypothetical protein
MRVVLDLRLFILDVTIRRFGSLSLVLGRWVHLYLHRRDFSLMLGPWTFSAGVAVRETEGKFLVIERSPTDAMSDYRASVSCSAQW